MKTHYAALLAVAVLAPVPAARPQDNPTTLFPPASDPEEPAYRAVPDVLGLPRVLLLGDSISIGYTLAVRADLAGRANVHRPAANCGETAYGLAHLDSWLGSGHWDVIHFNFGLHDLKYLDAKGNYVTPDKGRQVASPEQYGKNLRELVARLCHTGARLVFATTTPIPEGTDGRVLGDERRYNEVARRVMEENGIAIDDLGSYASRRQAQIQLPCNVHFTPQGYRELAELVSASMLAQLPVRPRVGRSALTP